jgi:hypothetical protein
MRSSTGAVSVGTKGSLQCLGKNLFVAKKHVTPSPIY